MELGALDGVWYDKVTVGKYSVYLDIGTTDIIVPLELILYDGIHDNDRYAA